MKKTTVTMAVLAAGLTVVLFGCAPDGRYDKVKKVDLASDRKTLVAEHVTLADVTVNVVSGPHPEGMEEIRVLTDVGGEPFSEDLIDLTSQKRLIQFRVSAGEGWSVSAQVTQGSGGVVAFDVFESE